MFLDRDLRDGIVVGEEWEQRLHERLRWADAVVCLLTSAYARSTWCTAEVGIAQSRGSRLLPVRAEPGVTHPLLTAVQQVDLADGSGAGPGRLAEALRRVDAAGGTGWPDDRSPFPGLRPFDTDLHRVFFGRTPRRSSSWRRLLRSPAERAERAVLLVVGPSGCGKSSLVRAGLLPVMAGEPGLADGAGDPAGDPAGGGADPRTRRRRPAARGWAGRRARCVAGCDDGGLAELAERPAAGRARDRGGRHLLIVVDQFEELLTQAAPAERARFADLLGPALAGPVQVVAPCARSSSISCWPARSWPTCRHGCIPLRPLRREALRAVIEGPARLAGIGVDDELVARLVADTDTRRGVAAAGLHPGPAGRRGGPRRPAARPSRYEQLGGVQGALARQADAALADATAATGRDPRAGGRRSCCGWSPSTSRAGRPGGGSAATSFPTRCAPSWTPSSRAAC